MPPEQEKPVSAESPSEPNSPAGLPDNAIPTQPETINLPPAKKRKFKKPLLIGFVVLLLAIAGFAYYWLKIRETAKEPEVTTSQTKTVTEAVKTQEATLYVVPELKSMTTYNTASKEKKVVNVSDKTLIGGALYTNSVVQTSKDGSVVAYTSGVYDEIQGVDGAPKEAALSIKSGDTEVKIVDLSNDQQIIDFALTPDGLRVYYLVATYKNNSTVRDLHNYDIATKKDTVIKQEVLLAKDYLSSPLILVTDGSLRFYASTGNSKINEYIYKNGALSNRSLQISSFCTDCRVEDGQPLSPDGKTLLLESGAIETGFSYYVLNLESGQGKQVYKTVKSTEQPRFAYWSPDSKKISFDISANGNAGQEEVGLKNRFDILEVESGKITGGFVDPSPGINDPNFNKHFVELLAWSPDGGYIAFANNGSVKIFKVSDSTVIDTAIAVSAPMSYNIGFGWYQ